MPPNPLPGAFIAKKAKILASLAQSDAEYTDKSPKGSVDAPIVDLIAEINRFDGLVTTSSCSGRVAVFVEGEHFLDRDDEGVDDGDDDDNGDITKTDLEKSKKQRKEPAQIRTGPGGKGGGKWLFVSHDPVAFPGSTTRSSISVEDQAIETEASTPYKTDDTSCFFTNLCGLTRPGDPNGTWPSDDQSNGSTSRSKLQSVDTAPRLIHLTFSPLILHILTAALSQHARPLLAAAINAGFRESGVQSLSILANTNHNNNHNSSSNPNNSITGTMVAIRTAGLNFETVVGRLHTVSQTDGSKTEVIEPLVSEEYLRICFGVINERFMWNEKRKEKLRVEIQRAFMRVESALNWEDKGDRSRRKREEGLRRKAEKEKERAKKKEKEEELIGMGEPNADGLFGGIGDGDG